MERGRGRCFDALVDVNREELPPVGGKVGSNIPIGQDAGGQGKLGRPRWKNISSPEDGWKN